MGSNQEPGVLTVKFSHSDKYTNRKMVVLVIFVVFLIEIENKWTILGRKIEC